MPILPIGGLSQQAVRAYPVIRGGVADGLSISAIGAMVRSEGYSISNAALAEAVHRERDIQAYNANLRFLPLGASPAEASMPEAWVAIHRNYSYQVTVHGTMIETGQAAIQYVTVTSSTRLTRQEIEEKAAEAFEGGGNYGMEIETATLSGALKAGPRGLV